MARAEPLASNPIAARFFAPIVRDWEKPLELLRILAENVCLIAGSLLIAHWLAPTDPFGVATQFPWIWIVPTLLALRYGTIDGVLASGMLLAAWLLPEPWGMTGGETERQFPQEYFLGGLVLVLVAGQFADVWNGRLSRIRAANAYLDERLTSLTRTHYLIRLSHQRLEQELLVRPVMLGDLLTELRPLSPHAADRLGHADRLISMLASGCEIESAAIYPMTNGVIDSTPAAVIGEMPDLNPSDPLIELAIDHRDFVHVRASEASLYRSNYLICGPVAASSGDMIGMLVVHTMPFFALNEENLQFVTVLLGYYADGLLQSKAIHPIITLRPSTPPDFALEVMRMKRLYDAAGIESSMVGLTFETANNGQTHFEHIRRIKRSTDLTWELETPKYHVLIILMPMSGVAAIEGMIARLDRSMRDQFNKTLSEAKVRISTANMSAAEVEWTLDDLLNRSGVQQQIGDSGLVLD